MHCLNSQVPCKTRGVVSAANFLWQLLTLLKTIFCTILFTLPSQLSIRGWDIHNEEFMIRVMSFNIRYGLANDGKNQWENRKALVLARIKNFSPSLFSLQECRDDFQADYIKENLISEYQFYGVRREGDGNSGLEMSPILFRSSEFQLIQTGHFWLSETPQIPGSKSWGSAFARTVTWAELKHTSSKYPFLYVNTHLDYQPTATYNMAQILQQWIEKVSCIHPVILTGDFNSDKHSPTYQCLTNTGTLFDVYQQAHPTHADDATFHGFGQPGAENSIDWILASRHFQVVSSEIDTYHEANLYPSDHYPITAILNWK